MIEMSDLRKALEPFAKAADLMDQAQGRTVVLRSGQSDGRFGELKIAHFRRAREAFSGGGESGDRLRDKIADLMLARVNAPEQEIYLTAREIAELCRAPSTGDGERVRENLAEAALDRIEEHVAIEVRNYEALFEAGKGEHGKPGYVTDATWSAWSGSHSMARGLLEYVRRARAALSLLSARGDEITGEKKREARLVRGYIACTPATKVWEFDWSRESFDERGLEVVPLYQYPPGEIPCQKLTRSTLWRG
jgi:hypothetical protein